jgi:hypothetical protein
VGARGGGGGGVSRALQDRIPPWMAEPEAPTWMYLPRGPEARGLADRSAANDEAS